MFASKTEKDCYGYTLYAEEITKKLSSSEPLNLMGHTIYKAPTLPTAPAAATSADALPRRQGLVLYENSIAPKTQKSRETFVADKNANAVKLFFSSENEVPISHQSLSGLILLSSDNTVIKNNINHKGDIKIGYVRMRKPFYITENNRVFSNSEDDVVSKINELKKQGYDGFIFDYKTGLS